MARDELPTGFLARTAASARVAAAVGRAGLRRLVRSSDSDDDALGERLFAELDGLKGMAMKVGQILSYLEVGLPEQTVARLARLQRGVTPLSLSAIRPVVEAELGAPLSDLFERFDPVPVAAASIGQVHRARVRATEVAVKVRYPGVRETFEADVRQLRAIASLASLATAVDGAALVAELRERLLEECDYGREMQNQALFAELLAGDGALVVPAVIADRCGPSVLTTAWHDGEPFDALRKADSIRRSAVARTLVRFPWTTLLRRGLLHADPHPGNFLFPSGDRVVVLDFGCVKAFAPDEVAAFRDLVLVLLEGRRGELARAAAALGLAPRPERLDLDELWALLSWMFAPYLTTSFRFERAWWESGLRFTRPGHPNARHLGFPPSWLWLQRTVLGLHSVLMKLDAEGDFASIVRAELDADSAAPIPDPPG